MKLADNSLLARLAAGMTRGGGGGDHETEAVVKTFRLVRILRGLAFDETRCRRPRYDSEKSSKIIVCENNLVVDYETYQTHHRAEAELRQAFDKFIKEGSEAVRASRDSFTVKVIVRGE